MHNKILTLDNLIKRGFQLPNRCILRKKEEEYILHILLHFQYAHELWGRVLKKNGCELIHEYGPPIPCNGLDVPFTSSMLEYQEGKK